MSGLEPYLMLANEHYARAREAIRQNDFHLARVSYLKCVESWKNVVKFDSTYEKRLSEAKQEYTDFAKRDPLYFKTLPLVRAEIEKRPGVLQTELYKILSSIEKHEISYVLYFAEEHGEIVRTKKGRTYQLTLRA